LPASAAGAAKYAVLFARFAFGAAGMALVFAAFEFMLHHALFANYYQLIYFLRFFLRGALGLCGRSPAVCFPAACGM
jgi:hypothetical protein